MKKLSLILLVQLLTSSLYGVTITGQGYADLEKDSLKEALSDLSNRISVNVKSDFKTYTKVIDKDYKQSKEKLVEISSSLPIKGALFDTLIGDRLTKTTASLTTKNALGAYTMELKRLEKNISKNLIKLKNTKNKTLKYNILVQLYEDIENFNKHKIVATMLDGKNLPTIKTTISDVKLQIQKIESKVPTIEIAAKLLTKNINKSKIYISAIKPSGSNQVTQFAKILKDYIYKNLNSTKKPSDANYFIRGNYEILNNSIFVAISLNDINNNILNTYTVTLDKGAYKHTKYKPNTKTFDESLNSDFIKSGKLYVDIGFKGYSRANGIDFVENDNVDIVVKTNKSMCYFLVGHTLKSDETFSYVLPIGDGNSPFINQITGNDVNKNITILEEIPVLAPFGSENLQIFSSTFSKDGSCPLVVPHCTENNDGYCVVNGKPSKVISITRGLNVKKKRKKIEKAENSISFTSFKK